MSVSTAAVCMSYPSSTGIALLYIVPYLLFLLHKGPDLEKTIGQIRPPICPATSPVIIKKRSSFSAAQLAFLTCVSLETSMLILSSAEHARTV